MSTSTPRWWCARLINALSLALVLGLGACDGGSGQGPGADTAPEELVSEDQVAAPDTGPPLDAVPDGSPRADTPGAETAESDLVPELPPGPGCQNLSGAYTLTSACDPSTASLDPVICIRQEECEAVVYSWTDIFLGTVDDETFEGGNVGETLSTTITATHDGLEMHAEASDGPLVCDGTGEAVHIPEVTSYCCDVVLQDCPGETEKCTMLSDGSTQYAVSGCVTETGQAGEGESCTLVSDGPAGWGRDDCAKGLFCTFRLSDSLDEYTCRPLCHSEGLCAGDGEGCMRILDTAPSLGYCLPPCDPFAPDCPDTTQCRVVYSLTGTYAEYEYRPLCTFSAGLAVGEVCSYNDDCESGAICKLDSGAKTCKQLCDDQHPCPDEGVCMHLGYMVTDHPGMGWCP